MTLKSFFSGLFISLFGCSPTIYTRGVPNLVQVGPGLWRSGQPTTIDSWNYLKSLGINHIVKLNFDSEGSDDEATTVGLIVYKLGIQPEGDKDILDNISNTFLVPDRSNIIEAEKIIQQDGGVLVHCTHGQDRTGLIIGIHRVKHESWTKDSAYREMLARHFHPELHGLQEFWELSGWIK